MQSFIAHSKGLGFILNEMRGVWGLGVDEWQDLRFIQKCHDLELRGTCSEAGRPEGATAVAQEGKDASQRGC